jgi:hypothetical protein
MGSFSLEYLDDARAVVLVIFMFLMRPEASTVTRGTHKPGQRPL